MSYKKAQQCYLERWEDGDPESALIQALRYLDSVSQNKRDFNFHHFSGVCHHEIEPDGDEFAEREFRAALELNPDYGPSHLYLGRVLFAQKRYAEALLHLQAGHSELGERSEPWSAVKNQELMVCCRLYLAKRPPRKELDALCKEYFKVNVVWAPSPLEIVNCVDELFAQGRIPAKSLRPWLYRLRDMISACGSPPEPPIAGVLERLRQAMLAQVGPTTAAAG